MKLQIGIDGNTYELEVEVIDEDEVAPYPRYGVSHPLPPATAQSFAAMETRKQARASEGTVDEDKLCRSLVTGVAVKVYVLPHQIIAENELIMTIEAMKMETNVTAPRAGKVKSVLLAAGDSVKVNQVVVELE